MTLTCGSKPAVAAALALALLSGCAAPGGMLPAPATDSRGAAVLAEVRRAFDAGDFGAAIRLAATSPELDAAPASTRVQAYKLQAFSYCVTGYAVLCRDTFERILALDRDFTLSPAEAGHPQWGPVFEEANRGR